MFYFYIMMLPINALLWCVYWVSKAATFLLFGLGFLTYVTFTALILVPMFIGFEYFFIGGAALILLPLISTGLRERFDTL